MLRLTLFIHGILDGIKRQVGNLHEGFRIGGLPGNTIKKTAPLLLG